MNSTLNKRLGTDPFTGSGLPSVTNLKKQSGATTACILALQVLLCCLAGEAEAIITQTPPTAVTLGASGTNDDAVLNGVVNPNGSSTVAWFEWRADLASSNTTQATDVGNGTSNVPFSVALSGLTAGVAYDYQIVASNSVGTATGQKDIFQLPRIILNGTNPLTNECHARFIDPGARATAAPLAVGGGYGYSMALKYDGTVAAWGNSGDEANHVPAALSNVVAIAAGEFHCLALKDDGMVVGWGDGIWGDTTPPNDVSNTVAIAAGSDYGLALNRNGTVFGWGDNSFGKTNVPQDLSNVVAIAGGNYHALALKSNGRVVGWGDNSFGKINIPADLSNVVAIAAGWEESLAIKSDGTVVGWGATCLPSGLSNVVSVTAGAGFGLAMKSDGTVIGWGDDSNGQISGITSLTNVVVIAAGMSHSLAVTGDGRLVVAGWNEYGQTSVPINFGGDVAASGFVDYNNPGTYTLTYAANNSLGGAATATRTVIVVDRTPPQLTLLGANPLIMPVNTTFIDPGATARDACAGDLTGSILVAGNVNNTVLGTNLLTYWVTDYSGNTTNRTRTVITVVGPPFVTTLTADGSNHNATLSATINPNGGSTTAWFEWGTNILYGNATTPAAVGNGLTNMTLIFTLSGLTPGIPYHWRIVATNSAGRSNGRDATFQNLPAIVQAPAVMLSGANPLTTECHTPFVDPGDAIITPLSAIAAGQNYSLALTTDGTVGAWGSTTTIPPGLNNVKAIAAGYSHSLALKTDGTVVGWGDNSYGETDIPAGLNNVVSVSAGWGFSLALKLDGTVVGWGLGATNPPAYDGLYFGQATVPHGLSNVVAIAAGFESSLALKSDGTVASWGTPQPWHGIYPDFGGIVLPDNLNQVVAIATGDDFGLALKSDGTVVGVGYSGEGQATVPAGLSNVVAIAAGFYHSLALKNDGAVVGGGNNFYGEAIPPASLKNVVAIAAGAYHSLALKSDGTVVGWGMGFYGETDITTSGTNLVTRIPGVGFVNANDPGRYTLTYRRTNSTGQTASVTRTVVVVDTTPPNLDCPANLTVEFAAEKGAITAFSPKATDLCDSSVNIKSFPASGSWFPIGTTTVLVRASDFYRNAATCSFQVTVLGAQGVISNLVLQLLALRGNVTNQLTYADLNGAISDLQQSLSPALWIDQAHLDPTNGGTAYNKDTAATRYLLKLIKDSHGTIPSAVMLGAIHRILKTDWLLSSVAIGDATKRGGNSTAIAKAKDLLAQGNAAGIQSQYLAAIGYYQNAWSLAIRQSGHNGK